jgi:hypothetical protein
VFNMEVPTTSDLRRHGVSGQTEEHSSDENVDMEEVLRETTILKNLALLSQSSRQSYLEANNSQQIKSKETKVLSKVASVSSISSNEIRSSLTLAQLAEKCEKKKARSAQIMPQSEQNRKCANQSNAIKINANGILRQENLNLEEEHEMQRANERRLWVNERQRFDHEGDPGFAIQNLNRTRMESYSTHSDRDLTGRDLVPYCKNFRRKHRETSSDSSRSSSPERKRHKKKKSHHKKKSHKKFDKDLFQVINKAPKFKGENENFEAWQQSILKYCRLWNLNKDVTVQTVENAIVGEANQLLGHTEKWNSVDEIFEKLGETYGMNIKTTNHLNSLKQKQDESARLFAGRVQYAVSLLKLEAHSEFTEELKLSTFINGLRLDIIRKINVYNLNSLKDAIKVAEKFDFIKTQDYTNRLYTMSSNAHNEFTKRPNDGKNVRYAPYQNQVRRTSQYNSNINTNGRINDRDSIRTGNGNFSNLKCYHCGKTGHSFRKCFKASTDDIKKIQAEITSKRSKSSSGTTPSFSKTERQNEKKDEKDCSASQ